MSVNYGLWGTPEQWRDVTQPLFVSLANFKRPKDGAGSFWSAYSNGNLPFNTTDDTLAFWGINKNSIIANPVLLASYWDNDQIKTAAEYVYTEPKTVPAIFVSRADLSTYANTTWTQRYSPDVISAAGMSNTIGYSFSLVTDFTYKNVVLIPFVRVGDTTGARNFRNMPLKEYIDGMTAGGTTVNLPILVSIGYQVALGDGTTNRATQLTGLGINFSETEKGSRRTYQYSSTSTLYQWYATQNGYDIRKGTQTTGDASYNTMMHIAPWFDFGTVDFSSLHHISDADTAIRYKYCINYYSGGMLYPNAQIYYYNPNDDIWQLNKIYDDSHAALAHPFPFIHCTPDNKNVVKEYVLNQIAYLGFCFVYNPNDALRGQIGDAGVYLPKFDNKGVTTGEYLDGAESLTLPNSQWTNGRESGYDPNAGEDDDGDTGNLNNFPTYQNRYANANAVYALDESNFIKFVSDVNNLYLTDTDDTRMKLDFKGSNPNDYIIGVYGVPFLCNYIVPSGGDTSINLGPVTLPTAQGKKVDTSTTLMRDCGTVTISAKGNFLDYEPYTQIELYIPMCGTIQLDCAQVIGRTLHVIVYYDITTMACVGCVYRDAPDGETLIHTINGTIGASLPLTSSRMGDYQNSVQTTKNALKQNEMRTALGVGGAVIGIAGAALAPETGGLSLALAGAAIGGLATAAGGAMTEKQLQYDLTHKQPALSQCSAADGMTAQLVSNLRPWVFIKRAEKLPSYDAATYGKTVGFACCINSTVGAFSGFTVYSNADLSGIPATKNEIDMIRAKLNNGIYI